MNDFCIEVKDLYFEYKNNKVLENINFSVRLGEYVSIVGPNGAGKSSLIKILLGLNTNYSGSAKVLNNEPSKVKAEYIGYVPQIKTLDRNFPATSIELVASGLCTSWSWRIKPDIREKCLSAMQSAGIEKLADRALNTLSGGELQRVYLARCLVRKPQILILDEPATGIDTKAESDMCVLIDNYKKTNNAAILTVTHDWNSAYHHSDYVLMLNRRQFCYEPPAKAFTDDILRELFGHIGHSHQMKFGVK